MVRTRKQGVALVTGGGRGIGRAIATALAAEGPHVAVVSRTSSELEQTVDAIGGAGGKAMAVAADVTRPGEVARAVQAARRLGPIELLVNNAGVGGPIGPMWETDPASWWRAVEVNLRGTFNCAHAVLPGMVERRRGRIINVASNAGVYRWPLVSHYAVAKAAVIKLTENLAAEASRHGIAVFAPSIPGSSEPASPSCPSAPGRPTARRRRPSTVGSAGRSRSAATSLSSGPSSSSGGSPRARPTGCPVATSRCTTTSTTWSAGPRRSGATTRTCSGCAESDLHDDREHHRPAP